MSLSRFVKKPTFKNAAQMSTPMIVTAFVLICMLVIFTIETLGLSNRAKVIELREASTNIDKSVLMKMEKLRDAASEDFTLTQTIHVLNHLHAQDKQEIHNRMLIDSVMFEMPTGEESDEMFFDL
jgi:hypothetical protein